MRILFIGVLFCAMTTAAFAESSSSIPTTIDQLIKSPDKYAGQTVRVEGQIDNCFGFTCNVCPDAMTNATFDVRECLGIDFYNFSGADNLMERAFRFAAVTLDARFDPTCLVDKNVVCLDRISELKDARVIEVRARHSALDGLVSWYNEGKLLPASGVDEQGMKSELSILGWPPQPDRKDEMHYFVLDDRTGPRKTGMACLCIEKDCDGHWPTRLFWGFDSVGNPFTCSLMEKYDAGWRITSDQNF